MTKKQKRTIIRNIRVFKEVETCIEELLVAGAIIGRDQQILAIRQSKIPARLQEIIRNPIIRWQLHLDTKSRWGSINVVGNTFIDSEGDLILLGIKSIVLPESEEWFHLSKDFPMYPEIRGIFLNIPLLSKAASEEYARMKEEFFERLYLDLDLAESAESTLH